MSKLTLATAVLGAAFFVSGCALFDRVVEPAAGLVARGIDKACEQGTTPLAIEARREIVAEINGKTTIGNHTPSDCDSDGLPDFEIDASGTPVPAG